jgi:hypothetical protein
MAQLGHNGGMSSRSAAEVPEQQRPYSKNTFQIFYKPEYFRFRCTGDILLVLEQLIPNGHA